MSGVMLRLFRPFHLLHHKKRERPSRAGWAFGSIGSRLLLTRDPSRDFSLLVLALLAQHDDDAGLGVRRHLHFQRIGFDLLLGSHTFRGAILVAFTHELIRLAGLDDVNVDFTAG